MIVSASWSALPQNGYAEHYTMLYEPDFAELDSTFLLARRISTSFISWKKNLQNRVKNERSVNFEM